MLGLLSDARSLSGLSFSFTPPHGMASAHTSLSQWLRPGNVAFVLGGVLGIVALASDLPSRAVKGLGIASAVVSMLFGVHDRTRTEKLTWSALCALVQRICHEEWSAMVADARSAYSYAMRDEFVEAVHVARTFYLRYSCCGLCRAPEGSYSKSPYSHTSPSVPVRVVCYIVPGIVQLGTVSIYAAAWLSPYTGWKVMATSYTVVLLLFFGLAVDVPLLVVLFAAIRLCGRILSRCRLTFTKIVCRRCQKAGDASVHVADTLDPSWRVILSIFLILLCVYVEWKGNTEVGG
ncbi:hypothetical protein EXIGLDRAFT_99393 [Exidia glandulosa HHB12029]|uniref:Uncharacterized protein n=1 Tax=Exidia glandulosa HHB12029 TaxID=1314781 RepID=A0A166BHA5_EXIGL|nr:hypothetical protein EXIGLDRAFT_99393 [Exidia glandulosa HHB12029]